MKCTSQLTSDVDNRTVTVPDEYRHNMLEMAYIPIGYHVTCCWIAYSQVANLFIYAWNVFIVIGYQ